MDLNIFLPSDRLLSTPVAMLQVSNYTDNTEENPHQMGTIVAFYTNFTFTVDKQKVDNLQVVYMLLVYHISKSM